MRMARRQRLAGIGAMLALPVLAAACGGGAANPGQGGSPAPASPSAGSPAKVMPGTMPHTTTGATPKVAVATGNANLRGAALAGALRRGGYVIFLRHGATDKSHPDARMVNLSNCSTQRPLNATGIADAKQVGAAIKTLKLPIGQVRYSPYCRTATTAQLEFGNTGQPDMSLVAADYHGVNQKAQGAAVLKMLGTAPSPGTDTALVSHQNTVQNATGLPAPPEGGAEIYQPRPGTTPLLAAELSPADWSALAKTSPGH
jgi:phosphohistidine phosphatase SixA